MNTSPPRYYSFDKNDVLEVVAKASTFTKQEIDAGTIDVTMLTSAEVKKQLDSRALNDVLSTMMMSEKKINVDLVRLQAYVEQHQVRYRQLFKKSPVDAIKHSICYIHCKDATISYSQTPSVNCQSCHQVFGKKRCSQCKCIYYCSQECQKKDWFRHKTECHLLVRK
jgi:hypothetical protein